MKLGYELKATNYVIYRTYNTEFKKHVFPLFIIPAGFLL